MALSMKHKALYLDSKYGSFVIANNTIPPPGPGELLIKVKASGLNPFDWKIQKYGIFVEDYPIVMGIDIAGDVLEVGEGVEDLAKGDRV
jgi:NADPH:quinone reductase-like Zn-dependent oxidoreductase